LFSKYNQEKLEKQQFKDKFKEDKEKTENLKQEELYKKQKLLEKGTWGEFRSNFLELYDLTDMKQKISISSKSRKEK